MIKFDHNSIEKQLVCSFSGRLDTLVCLDLVDEVKTKLLELKQKQNESDLIDDKVEFNMKEVTFISSSFIRICIITLKQCKKGNFTVVNCDPFLKKTFKIAGLDDLLCVS